MPEQKEPKPEDPALTRALQECQKLRDEYLAGWQRSRADLLNYKKEEMERIRDVLKYSNENLILKILPILDNFDIAIKNLPDKGLLQIKIQLQDFLKNQGVEEIKAVGEKFDPSLHEVVEETEIKDNEQGTILEEIKKGYKINGRLLRPAKVRVTK